MLLLIFDIFHQPLGRYCSYCLYSPLGNLNFRYSLGWQVEEKVLYYVF